ncbi:MAG: DMT family transporter [Clostridia bacterium]|nr:DMT family transporter [Clostridia bacterium]
MSHSGRFARLMSPVYLVTAVAIWGMGFVTQKQASAVPAITMAAWRSAFALVFVLAVVLVSGCFGKSGRRIVRPSRKGRPVPDITRAELIGGALSGVMVAVATVLQQAGMNAGTDGGKAAFITTLYVVVVPVLGFAFFGRRSPLHVWIGVLVSVVGFFLLCITEDFTVVWSDMSVFGCSVLFALQILVIDRFAPQCDALRLSLVQFFVMFVITAVTALIVDPFPTTALFVDHLPSVLYLGIGSSGMAFTCQILGQKHTPPAVASVILSMEAVVATIGAAILLHETMSPREIIGCAIVLFAALLSQLDVSSLWARLRRKPTDTPPTDTV